MQTIGFVLSEAGLLCEGVTDEVWLWVFYYDSLFAYNYLVMFTFHGCRLLMICLLLLVFLSVLSLLRYPLPPHFLMSYVIFMCVCFGYLGLGMVIDVCMIIVSVGVFLYTQSIWEELMTAGHLLPETTVEVSSVMPLLFIVCVTVLVMHWTFVCTFIGVCTYLGFLYLCRCFMR